MIGVTRQLGRFITSIWERKGQQTYVVMWECCGKQRFSTASRRFAKSSSKPSPYLRLITKKDPWYKKIYKGGYVLLLAPALFVYLGVWQVQRLKWKMGILDMMNERQHLDPIPLPEDLREIENLEYQAIQVRGTFDHSREVVVAPKGRVESQNQAVMRGLQPNAEKNEMTHYGGWVVTPFKLADRNVTILINRGWVPHSKMDTSKRQKGQIEGEVELVGLVKLREKPSKHVESNTYTRTFKGKDVGLRFLVLDVTQIAQYLNTAPVCLNADADSTVEGGPVGGQTKVTIRNDHFSYICIWFALAILTAYSWYRMFVKTPQNAKYLQYVEGEARRSKFSDELKRKHLKH